MSTPKHCNIKNLKMYFQLEILQICQLQKQLLQYIHRLLCLLKIFWVYTMKKTHKVRLEKRGMMDTVHAQYMLAERNWCLLNLIMMDQKKHFTKIRLFQIESFIISNLFYFLGFIGILHLKEFGMVKTLYFNLNLSEIIIEKK